MVIPYVMKKCNKCGKWLVVSSINFRKHKTGKYGVRGDCNECQREYRNQKKEHITNLQKQWREENKEYYKKYYQDHKEAMSESKKRYNLSPKGQIIEINRCARRRAKEQAQGNGITAEQWLECMKFFNFRCAYSGEYIGGNSKGIRSLDHIEPINKGGANEIWNLVPMYMPYNSSKHDKDMLEWYTEQPYFSQERLNKIYEWQEYAFNKWGKENLTEAE